MANRQKNGQLIAGIIVVTLGVLLLIENLVGFYVRGIWQLWPLLVVALGIFRLTRQDDDARQRRSGLVLMVVGLWLLVNTLELFGFEWGTSWPLLLIALGLGKLVYPDGEGYSGGLLLVLIGSWALINVLELWGVYWDNSWPIAIIIGGVIVVWKALFERTGSAAKENANDNA